MAMLLAVLITMPAMAIQVVRMQTDFGGIDITLRDDVAPMTVANFLEYANSGAYDGTYIHRNIPGFVVQGGGFRFNPDDGSFFGGGSGPIPKNDPVDNEAGLPGALSNVRATIAMAKVPAAFDDDGNLIPGTGPDSATNQWFFNLADNSGDPPDGLDFQNGGFTAFAEVPAAGMVVVDLIAAQDVCKEIPGLGQLCGASADTIQVDASNNTQFDTERLLLVNNVGADGDGDGIIDRIEAAAPGGDSSNQNTVAAFIDRSGRYVTIESPAGVPLQSMNVLGSVCALTTFKLSPALPEFSFLTFAHGYTGYGLGAAAGSSVTVTLTLPAGESTEAFYNFGPTAADPSDHWYKFDFDGETGAEINGNVITLNYVDGKRGDTDLNNANGIVVAPSGPARNLNGDQDGIADEIEEGAPNNGDGNNDGIADSLQSHVASLPDIRNSYVTLEVDQAHTLRSLNFTEGTNFLAAAEPLSMLNRLNFVYGFLSFEVAGVANGGNADVRIIFPEGEKPVKFFKFGPTPDNPVDHLYEFDFDGETGAEFNGNEVTLHFVDGKRGDSDLAANGVITDPGTPALRAQNSGSGGGGGGGCSLQPEGTRAGQAGAWWLLAGMACLFVAGRRRCRRQF